MIEVSAALVIGPRGLLIARRPAGVHLAGLWEFPGGKREQGETFLQCLEREIEEELGVRISAEPWAYEVVEHRYPEKSVHIRFFLSRIVRGELEAKGCSEVAWATRETLMRYQFPEADASLIERLCRDEAIWFPEHCSMR